MKIKSWDRSSCFDVLLAVLGEKMYLFSILAIDIISRFLTADSLYVGTKENDNVSTHQDPR